MINNLQKVNINESIFTILYIFQYDCNRIINNWFIVIQINGITYRFRIFSGKYKEIEESTIEVDSESE